MFLRQLLYRVLYAPANDADALAAVSAAIDNPNGPPASGGDDADAGGEQGGEAGGEDPPAGSGDREGAPEGDAAGGDAGDEPTADELAAAEAAAKEANAKAGDGAAAGEPPVGHERDAKGRFVKKAKAEPPDPAAAKGAKPEIDPATGKPKAAPAKKQPDHINDPIPDDLKGRTRERMEGLVKAAKDLTAELETAKAEAQSGRELVEMIEATGAKPETFARHMDVLALMHSPNVEDKQQVLGYLRKAAEIIGKQLGEVPDDKALEGHADLIEDVESGELKRERAIEIAKSRNREAAATRLRTENNQQTDAQRKEAEKKLEVKNALNDLSTELRKKDGDEVYARKHKLLVPFIKRLNGALPTDKLLESVREAYAAIELGPAATKTNGGNRAPAGTGNQQPQRHRQAAGGGAVKTPTSGLEALNLGLEEEAAMRGRA